MPACQQLPSWRYLSSIPSPVSSCSKCRAERASGLKPGSQSSPYRFGIAAHGRLGRSLLCFFLLSSPTPTLTLSAVYNKLLSCIQKKQAHGRIWLCCLELFTACFGLSRQGHKYTVNLPDSKNGHLGPKRLTACETQKPHLSCASQLCARLVLCRLDGGGTSGRGKWCTNCPSGCFLSHTVFSTLGASLGPSWTLEEIC